MKNIFRAISIGIAVMAGLYLVFMLAGGGFGKKEPGITLLSDSGDPFLFAHRGVTGSFPENSRGALDRAREIGYPGAEIDLRKTADGDYVIFHDADARRLLGVDKMLHDMATADVISHPLLYNGEESPYRVMTLDELKEEYDDDFIFYFDMKLKGPGEAKEICRYLAANDLTGRVILANASIGFIFYTEAFFPEICTALEGFNAGKEWIYWLIPKKLKPDFLSSFASRIDGRHMEWLRRRDLEECRIVYGVDSTNFERMKSLGVRNMIID
jgi:glycerophosphoryl diester phosphodiesterase